MGRFQSQRNRTILGCIVVAVSVVTAASLAGIGFARSAISAAQYQYGKVTICHHTHSKSNPTVTITISKNAWPAHQKHGDTLGPCPPAPSQPDQGKDNGKGKGGDNAGSPGAPSPGQNTGPSPGQGKGDGSGGTAATPPQGQNPTPPQGQNPAPPQGQNPAPPQGQGSGGDHAKPADTPGNGKPSGTPGNGKGHGK